MVFEFCGFFGDFDCFCTKLVIFMFKCRVCRGFHQPYHLLTKVGCFGRYNDILSVSGVEVERVKTLDNLIDQSEQLGGKFNNDDVFHENFDKFCDVDQKIIKKSPKTRQQGPVWVFCFLMILRHYSMVFEFCGKFCGF